MTEAVSAAVSLPLSQNNSHTRSNPTAASAGTGTAPEALLPEMTMRNTAAADAELHSTTNEPAPALASTVLLHVESIATTTTSETISLTASTTPVAHNRGSNNNHATTTTTKPPPLLTLPMDSLHSIASFLSPAEWCHVGAANKLSRKVCREIVRRVRLHAYKCACEIVHAFHCHHIADAKELAALYIQNGVPVYPRSLGHSYHTLVWRSQIEIQQTNVHDDFFQQRLEFRAREGYSDKITYLAEKAVYYVEQQLPAAALRNRSPSPVEPTTQRRNNDPNNNAAAAARGLLLPSSSPPPQPPSLHEPRININIHRHLWQQHELGKDCVKDKGGTMVAPPISLSADFFHPIIKTTHQRMVSGDSHTPGLFASHGGGDDDMMHRPVMARVVTAAAMPHGPLGHPLEEGQDDVVGMMHHDGNLEEGGGLLDPLDENQLDVLLAPPAATTIPIDRLNAALSCVELDVYTSFSGNTKSDDVTTQDTKRHLRSRFATYQRRLETFLATSDHSGFDECMLDFWDEFFPHTAGFQYYDQRTAVPRISNLHKFLTKPCPKAVGIVQCEIERINITTKGKGVNVKGRLFPTYEYRLFIRNYPMTVTPDGSYREDDKAIRRDTVLMVAKNRGRKYADASGVVSASTLSKKGSNNYYLYLPQQMDVDAHFNHVNECPKPSTMVPNGPSMDPVIKAETSVPVLLGRLQSNFIGTEFQILTPHLQKRRRQRQEPAPPHYSPSEDEADYDSGMSSDNTASRRSRFGRLSLRRGTTGSEMSSLPSGEVPLTRGRSPTMSRGRKGPVARARSCPDIQQAQTTAMTRQTRTNRRAIANTPDDPCLEPLMYEEEDGAITYTANLLGSRPRIMDVCIPKVSAEGVAAAEWKRYLSTCDDMDEQSMLSCFRHLQQRVLDHHENPGQGGESDSDSEAEAVPEDFGLMALQNRPPWWNIELGSFVLNFGGRVSVASVKNFQLCERTDHDRIMLQFGRIGGRHSFTMDFQHPLSAVQAFSIAISSLQSKISFG